MDAIYSALVQGWPQATINASTPISQYVVWGLIGTNQNLLRNSSNIPALFVDMPYYGRLDPRFNDWDNSFWRMCPNAVHDNRVLNKSSERFDKWNVRLAPWRTEGDHILICPSSETMTRFVYGMSCAEWIQQVTQYLREKTNRPIRVRPKPRKNNTSGPHCADIPITSDLKNCHAVVVSGSLSGIDALIAGIPVISTNEMTPAIGLTTKIQDVNNCETPEREQVFHDLAWKQFSIAEMRSGLAYDSLMETGAIR